MSEQQAIVSDLPKLQWEHGDTVQLDSSLMFGDGYDFFGLENLRREASGPNGNYLMWPAGDKWSLYRDTDGMFCSSYESREKAEAAAERWCEDDLGN